MSPDWWETAELQAMADHDPLEHGGRDWPELTDFERTRAIKEALDDLMDQGEPSGMLGR